MLGTIRGEDASSIEKFNHFHRVRRNLVLVSILCLIYFSGEMKLDQISFLGNRVLVDKPEIVNFWLVVFFVYFFARYVSIFFQMNAFRDYWGSVNLTCQDIQKDIAIEHFRKPLPKNWEPDINRGTIRGHYLRKRILSLVFYKWDFPKILLNLDDEIKEHLSTHFVFSKAEMLIIAIRSYIINLCTRSEFLEIIFPFLLAALAVAEICGFRVCQLVLDFIEYLRNFRIVIPPYNKGG